MKNLLIAIPAFLFIVLLSSCDGSKKTSENQSATTTTAGDKMDSDVNKDQSNQNASTQSAENQDSEKISGTQLIENTVDRMTTKLNLSKDQPTVVKEILTQTFLATGEKMDNVYNNEKYRTLSKDIVVKSSDAIMPVLDDNQKETFKKFVQH